MSVLSLARPRRIAGHGKENAYGNLVRPRLPRIEGSDNVSAAKIEKPGRSAMATIVGTGDFKYRIVEDWAKLPDGWSFKEVGAVGVDGNDNVYVFNRGDHPMMVFDRSGTFLRSWGEGEYPRAHGVHMGPDESIYLTDDGGHFVRKCRLDLQNSDAFARTRARTSLGFPVTRVTWSRRVLRSRMRLRVDQGGFLELRGGCSRNCARGSGCASNQAYRFDVAPVRRHSSGVTVSIGAPL